MRIFSLLHGRLGLFHFVTLREAAFGEDYMPEFCGGKYSQVTPGKRRVAVASDQPIYRCYLDLVVKRLHFLNSKVLLRYRLST